MFLSTVWIEMSEFVSNISNEAKRIGNVCNILLTHNFAIILNYTYTCSFSLWTSSQYISILILVGDITQNVIITKLWVKSMLGMFHIDVYFMTMSVMQNLTSAGWTDISLVQMRTSESTNKQSITYMVLLKSNWKL